MTNILKIKDLSYKVNNLLILKNITFDIKEGSFVSIVGPLGCGKTTLLKIINNSNNKTISTSFVFQKTNLLPWLTVKQNIELPWVLEKLAKKVIRQKTEQILKITNLSEFVDFYPDKLSEGMKQLVSIARSMASDSKLLLWDEPFASLDILSREMMNQKALDIYQLSKKTIILTTHSVSEAVYLSSKVIVLSKRPASIKTQIQIPFSYPRSFSLMQTLQFQALCQQVRKNIQIGLN